MDALTIALLSLVVVLAGVAALGAWRRGPTAALAEGGEAARLAASEKRLLDELDRLRSALDGARRDDARAQAKGFGDLELAMTRSLGQMREAQSRALSAMQADVDARLGATLETRLGESFRQVSERLEEVHRGLGEMRALAAGVGDLKRVLGNVRVRGSFGEAHLGALLDQVLAPEQYMTNVATIPGSDERVEFAVKLPGPTEGGRPVLLPIDAKFPQEDYQRLLAASEVGDAAAAEDARRALAKRIRLEAETIRTKYVAPPHTTDFAILFLASEGLFAEALRVPGLSDELQTRFRVIPAGPTTLFAILSSLSMGFRTVAIERRSADVSRLLGAVKTEFGRFGASLDAVSKKLSEATSKLEETTRRTRVMQRKLVEVESLPEPASAHVPIEPRVHPLALVDDEVG